MGLADYLAKNYLSADSKPSKKRKRKHASEANLTIADETDTTLSSRLRPTSDDETDGPTIVSRTSNTKATTWKTIGAAAPSNDEQAAADAILTSAANEATARDADDDAAPTIAQMANGASAGLQTAAQVSAALAARSAQEKAAMMAAGLDPSGKAQETIYRDASGRIINVAMKRAELRRAAEEEERKKIAEKEGARGDVQRREREERKKELEAVGREGLARYADDEHLNKELKEVERWNDPAARFLSTKTKSSGGGKGGVKGKTYVGAFEPNRYGIRPGFRWDGVDRSIGFEKKWFEARNRQKDIKDLKYAWQMDE